MGDRVKALGEVTWDVLQRMVREIVARKPGGHLVEANLREMDIRLPLALAGPDADPEVFAERLTEVLEQIVDDAVQQAAAFRPGHAFCHRCGGPTCGHSQPPSSRHVFVGYAPTGTPVWGDFAQYCLDLRHPDVDLLYEDPPVFVTIQQDARTLHGKLLAAFEAQTYELLGQLAAGFFPIRARAAEGRGVVALTFQVAASGSANGRRKLGLNILGKTPGGEDLGMLWEREQALPWHRAIRWAQTALGSMSTGRRGRTGGRRRPEGRAEIQDRVDGILGGLARRLGRDLRARTRRTSHAEMRHESGDRPTRMALDDIRTARDDAFLVDERRGTVVVLGERGRTHFFSPEGRHVSSVRYSRDAIERKRKLGLWRDAARDEVAAFREKLPAGGPE